MNIRLNCQDGHIPIETMEDFNHFLDETNGMHDAYLLSSEYRTHVRANHDTVFCYGEGESLVLRYMVTSMFDLSIVELTFLDVSKWIIPNEELFGLSVSFNTQYVTVLDGPVTLISENGVPDNITHVTARKMYWRITDRPGLNLQRGGTKDAFWYVIPNLWLPMNERLEDYTRIVEELAETATNAKLYHTDLSQIIPCCDADFTTEQIYSFCSDKPVFAEEGKAFYWHELKDREALKNAISRLDHGNMIAICDNEGMVFTVELIERGYFNMVICGHRGRIPICSFCHGKFYAEPYSGGGMDELS